MARAPLIAILLALLLPCALLRGQELGIAQDKHLRKSSDSSSSDFTRSYPQLTSVPKCPCSAGFCKETPPLSVCVRLGLGSIQGPDRYYGSLEKPPLLYTFFCVARSALIVPTSPSRQERECRKINIERELCDTGGCPPN